MTKEEIMEAIENMTVLELSELVKAMEEKFGVSAAAAPLPLHRPARNQRRFFQVVLLYVLPPPPAGPGLAPGRAVSLGPHDPQGPGPAGDESIGLLQKLPSPTGPAAAKREGENMQ